MRQDGESNYVDVDSDGDGISDAGEGESTTATAMLLSMRYDHDSDGDGGSTSRSDVDTDSDGTPDYLDLDSDSDGLSDIVEAEEAPTRRTSTPTATASTDLIEFAAGTDGTNPADNPQANGDFVFIVPYQEPTTPTKTR